MDTLIAEADEDDVVSVKSERPSVALQAERERQQPLIVSNGPWWDQTALLLEFDLPLDDCESVPLSPAAFRVGELN